MQALAAIEADAVESESEEEALETPAGAPCGRGDSNPSNCRAPLGSSQPVVQGAPDVADVSSVPKAPFSSPVKRSAPFTAYARLREARLARQRLMSPLPVCRPQRRSRTGAAPRDSSNSMLGEPKSGGGNDFAAVQATMLLGLWRLGDDAEDEKLPHRDAASAPPDVSTE